MQIVQQEQARRTALEARLHSQLLLQSESMVRDMCVGFSNEIDGGVIINACKLLPPFFDEMLGGNGIKAAPS